MKQFYETYAGNEIVSPLVSQIRIEFMVYINAEDDVSFINNNYFIDDSIGKFLSNKIKEAEWSSRAIESLAKTIAQFYPEIKGFTRSGLYRMIQFYETYSDNIIVAPLVRQISWTNNIVIFSHQSSIEEKEFYIRLCIKNNYSKRELERQIVSHYYERLVVPILLINI